MTQSQSAANPSFVGKKRRHHQETNAITPSTARGRYDGAENILNQEADASRSIYHRCLGFPDFHMDQQAEGIMSIAGPFMRDGLEQRNVISSLYSITSVAIECSAKMRTSCRPFSFGWDECGVMFNHDSHNALNKNTFGQPLQQNYMRVALVVTPIISHYIDNASSMSGHKICKANGRRDVDLVLSEFGPELVRLGRETWKIQAEALAKASFNRKW
ncbi:hypothetical protein F5883DRAFT_720918 [Diaporthe sp. PMI_573]|nr:hypothetical protein F5883DRAFT_720918 [Diaporthaceae sp. PMI_573]